MFPIRDSIRARGTPWVTVLLVVVNCVVFVWELLLGWQLDEFIVRYSIVPVRYTDWHVVRLYSPVELGLPFLTSMFIHGGWVHLLGNMWFLWIFGDNVEDKLGHFRFLVLYLVGGVFASVFHILTNPNGGVPTIGASGAVAAVMGAYFRYFPLAYVETIIPPFVLGPTVALPAILFLGVWFVLQFFNGALSLAGTSGFGGVAWWAHIGGFIFGVFAAGHFARRRYRVYVE